MHAIHRNHYRIRFAEENGDIMRAEELRHAAFIENRPGARPRTDGLDRDAFDDVYRHLLIEDEISGTLVACFRLLPLRSGEDIGRSYTARFYDLSALQAYPASVIEMGRFCMRPGWRDPAILRLAWGAVANVVDACDAGLLFGCSSFTGASHDTHAAALDLLAARYRAPPHWMPGIKAPQVVTFADRAHHHQGDPRDAFAALPPLLRSYPGLGGWVSNHAVIDTDLDTLHVFTGLEIDRIPPHRARRLRDVLPPMPPLLAELAHSA
ncbi:GNAT family N-acetyltransferase [Saliniramus sp.]|uniref:GNAT family N-acetyltransferase n=1 Tax=Saliniramus sp. TaxID=2986772 RepID=UPI002BADB763|nr:GNAT family N-acyltransferase [Saliniramus sp.]HMB10429.1 GNAT family N-acyltransferase [Saliniramus sp.]